jgi:predicted DCC family thiol-disulfide oxidoreductase YuxK
MKVNLMASDKAKIHVYYDGACPQCIRDRLTYEKLAGKAGDNVFWVDITGQEQKLCELGIDPIKALTELHVKDENQRIVSEMDAYILLMSKVPVLQPIAWLIGLPMVRPMLARIYHWQVNRRLHQSGRL